MENLKPMTRVDDPRVGRKINGQETETKTNDKKRKPEYAALFKEAKAEYPNSNINKKVNSLMADQFNTLFDLLDFVNETVVGLNLADDENAVLNIIDKIAVAADNFKSLKKELQDICSA